MTEYEKDLNELKEQILKDGNTSVTKRDLLERFCEIDEEYNGEPWYLLQILANINVLIGEEPCEDCVSRQAVLNQTHLWSKDEFLRVTNPFYYLRKRINSLPSVVPKGITVTDFADKCRECGKLRKSYKEKNKNNK